MGVCALFNTGLYLQWECLTHDRWLVVDFSSTTTPFTLDIAEIVLKVAKYKRSWKQSLGFYNNCVQIEIKITTNSWNIQIEIHCMSFFTEISADCSDSLFNEECQELDSQLRRKDGSSVCDDPHFSTLCCTCLNGRK